MQIKSKAFLLLILIALGKSTLIHSQTCDSAISVCPKVFDRLIKNDVLAVQYKAHYLTLLAETNQYAYAVSQKDSTIADQRKIIGIDNQEKQITQDQLKQSQKDLHKSERKNKLLKFGILASWIAGCASTIYFVFN